MTINYHLNELSASEFEDLVVHICLDILGQGTNSFAAGRDGGRDATFEGTANRFPSESESESAKGKFVIQAKHTASPIASCSDREFNSILKKEIPKIKKLFQSNELENYLLFTNRKLTGDKATELTQYLKEQTNVTNVWLRGKEAIEKYLRENSKLVRDLNLNRFRQPLQIHPEQLVSIIDIFYNYLDEQELKSDIDLEYLNLEQKNKINELSEEYFEYIKENSEIYFDEIKKFLEKPRNKKQRNQYQDIVSELKGKLIIHRDEFGVFEKIFEHLY
ncbi:ABC-three component system protein, partial [Candidatus Albibeggiatoa sp. nov. BB20]|uniref:ABC-three component system protein n=1 Tax=Candidatus Albibeggiatoa sp. nov. BB20 TaxID=3162723 RepID=UPI003365A45B